MTARRRGTQVEALPRKLSYARPKGEQLQEILEGVIAALEPGALLPSERLLAERYGVARATVTQAVEGLVSRGLVYRVHGSGTFVAEPKFRQPLTLTSFTEDMRARGMTPGSVVRSQAVVPASEVVARHLALVPGSPVVHLERAPADRPVRRVAAVAELVTGNDGRARAIPLRTAGSTTGLSATGHVPRWANRLDPSVLLAFEPTHLAGRVRVLCPRSRTR